MNASGAAKAESNFCNRAPLRAGLGYATGVSDALIHPGVVPAVRVARGQERLAAFGAIHFCFLQRLRLRGPARESIALGEHGTVDGCRMGRQHTENSEKQN